MKMLFFFVLLSVQLAHAVIEAPDISTDFQQNPAHIQWKQILTENFEIIFPENVEADAQRVAHLLEKAYPFVTRSLEVKPPRISVILQNQSVNSNGFVTLAPRRSEWFLTPSIDPELSNTEWLKTLAIHEFRHVVQFHKTRRGFNRAYEIVLGEIGQALGLGLTLPPWFLEGDAVGIETALTEGGRGRLPLFDRDLRALLLSGKDWDYDKAHLGSYEDYVPSHYVYGYFYTTWMRNQYGDLFLSKLSDKSAYNSWNPLTFYNAAEDLTGKNFDKLYREVMRDLIKEWQARADKIPVTPYLVKTMGRKWGWTNYLYPQATSEGKTVALKNGLSFIDHFVLLDGKEEEVLFYPGPLQNEYPYKVRGNKLVFFEWEFDPRWGYRDYARLRVYDLKKKQFTLTRNETKGRLAVPDHEGKKIAYIEWDEKQRQFIVILSDKGKTLLRLPHRTDEVITSLDWLNHDELVFVFKDHEDEKAIKKVSLRTKEETLLSQKSKTNIGFLSVENGEILFESPESGVDNIWLLASDGPRQITSAKYGAYAPEVHNDTLVYNDYTVDGMDVVEKALPWKERQHSSDSFYPIFEKFSKSENILDFEKELSQKETYAVSDYSEVKNSINLHSWVILAPPLSSTVTLVGLSRDVLNNFTLSAGTEYDLNEQTLQGFVGAVWSHYYPVFDLRAAYGDRSQDLIVDGSRVEDNWEEGTLEAGVSIPWRYVQGRFIHAFTSRAFSRLIKVTGKKTTDNTEVSDGLLYSPGFEISYGVSSRFAKRDINPTWGFFVDGRVEEGKDITGVDMKGSLLSIDSRYYLPGFLNHHSFNHQFAYEKQRDDSYQYSSFVLYPRGTRKLFLEEFTKYSGNYLLPLFYPDWSASRYLYLKRVSLNLFYDELNGRVGGLSYHAASAGWETLLEVNFLRIFIPFTVGVRGSYVLQGRDKDNNYEVFLSTAVGTF